LAIGRPLFRALSRQVNYLNSIAVSAAYVREE
jgi:hypothetical protein